MVFWVVVPGGSIEDIGISGGHIFSFQLASQRVSEAGRKQNLLLFLAQLTFPP
jgi:hypothetical protein